MYNGYFKYLLRVFINIRVYERVRRVRRVNNYRKLSLLYLFRIDDIDSLNEPHTFDYVVPITAGCILNIY